MSAPITTRLIEGDSARLELDAAEIRVVAGPDRGLKCALGTESLLIGSANNCDIVLHDTSVSARHAEIVASHTGYSIRDLQSTNGVLLGPHRIERAPLTDGVRLALGETTIVVRALGERLSFPLAQPTRLGELVAHSVKMRAFVATLHKIAAADTTVLLEGETGTGKEVSAEALHELSSRRHGPFVICDCSAISHSLMTAELFGYERGAFTDAAETRGGLLERADGGTLFLDEVGEVPLELQPLLLAALERKAGRRIGGKSDIRYDVRIVAATNRNLAEEVRAGRFRSDLFYRLAVVRLRLPPLRERPEDVPLLAEAFAKQAGLALSHELMVPLTAYDWPGNVRELRNMIQRMVIQPDEIKSLVSRPRTPDAQLEQHEPMFDEHQRIRTLPEARRLTTESFERRYLETVLVHTGGNLSRAAKLAGITRQSLTELAIKHGLHPRG